MQRDDDAGDASSDSSDSELDAALFDRLYCAIGVGVRRKLEQLSAAAAAARQQQQQAEKLAAPSLLVEQPPKSPPKPNSSSPSTTARRSPIPPPLTVIHSGNNCSFLPPVADCATSTSNILTSAAVTGHKPSPAVIGQTTQEFQQNSTSTTIPAVIMSKKPPPIFANFIQLRQNRQISPVCAKNDDDDEDSLSCSPISSVEKDDGKHAAGGGELINSSVVMVYNVSARFTSCDMVFNLFGQYGNVAKVLFITSRAGACLVQMADVSAARRCIKYLNRVWCFEQMLEVCPSKHAWLKAPSSTFHELNSRMPDGSPAYKDFTSSKFNCYFTMTIADRKRWHAEWPSRRLRFYNVSPAYNAPADIVRIFKNLRAPLPDTCIFGDDSNARRDSTYNKKFSKNSLTGFVEWSSLKDAVEAMVIANHYVMSRHLERNQPNEQQEPVYSLELCFTSSSRRSRQLHNLHAANVSAL